MLMRWFSFLSCWFFFLVCVLFCSYRFVAWILFSIHYISLNTVLLFCLYACVCRETEIKNGMSKNNPKMWKILANSFHIMAIFYQILQMYSIYMAISPLSRRKGSFHITVKTWSFTHQRLIRDSHKQFIPYIRIPYIRVDGVIQYHIIQ